VNPCLAPPGVSNPVGPSDANGHVCVDGLAWNGAGTNYYVSETDPPSGYAIDDTTAHAVTVSANASCPSTGTPATITFKDTPLTTLEVIATSEATGGTKSKISCVDSTNTTVGTSITTFVDPADWKTMHLKPDTYTCTVIIDP
jgi:prealbumin domain-containing protein